MASTIMNTANGALALGMPVRVLAGEHSGGRGVIVELHGSGVFAGLVVIAPSHRTAGCRCKQWIAEGVNVAQEREFYTAPVEGLVGESVTPVTVDIVTAAGEVRALPTAVVEGDRLRIRA